MKKRFVIKTNNIYHGLPIFKTITALLALIMFDAPEWVWIAVGVIFSLYWIISIVELFLNKKVDILEALEILDEIKEDEDSSTYRGKTFWEKMDVYKTDKLIKEADEKT